MSGFRPVNQFHAVNEPSRRPLQEIAGNHTSTDTLRHKSRDTTTIKHKPILSPRPILNEVVHNIAKLTKVDLSSTRTQHRPAVPPGLGKVSPTNIASPATNRIIRQAHDSQSRSSKIPLTPTHKHKSRKVINPSARREQPFREVKLMRSIEQSPAKYSSKTNGSPHTPSTVHEPDATWTPTSQSSSRLSFGETPVRRDTREHLDESPRHRRIVDRISHLPYIHDNDHQRRKYEDDDFVEQHEAAFTFDIYNTKKNELRAMKNLLLKVQREQKGKGVEIRERQEILSLGIFKSKRKRENEDQAKKSYKQPKREPSLGGLSRALENQADVTQETDVAFDRNAGHQTAVCTGKAAKCTKLADPARSVRKNSAESSLDDVPRKQTREIIARREFPAKASGARNPIKAVVPTTAGSQSEGHWEAKANTRETMFPSSRSYSGGSCSSTGRRVGRQNEPDRREINMPASRRLCQCFSLPQYFVRNFLREPKLSAFGGSEAEYMTAIRQISQCPGHPGQLIKNCHSILEQKGATGRVPVSPPPSL